MVYIVCFNTSDLTDHVSIEIDQNFVPGGSILSTMLFLWWKSLPVEKVFYWRFSIERASNVVSVFMVFYPNIACLACSPPECDEVPHFTDLAPFYKEFMDS